MHNFEAFGNESITHYCEVGPIIVRLEDASSHTMQGILFLHKSLTDTFEKREDKGELTLILLVLVEAGLDLGRRLLPAQEPALGGAAAHALPAVHVDVHLAQAALDPLAGVPWGR